MNWRSLSNSQLASQIEETLEVEQGNEVRKRISLLLAKESSKIVIERWGLEKFPSAQRPDHQDRWITALDSAIEKFAPIAEWYDTILKVDALTYVGNDSSGLDVTFLFRPKWNNVVLPRENTVANFDVLLRFPTDLIQSSPRRNPKHFYCFRPIKSPIRRGRYRNCNLRLRIYR